LSRQHLPALTSETRAHFLLANIPRALYSKIIHMSLLDVRNLIVDLPTAAGWIRPVNVKLRMKYTNQTDRTVILDKEIGKARLRAIANESAWLTRNVN
jgi:hypothetical protein